MRRHREAEGDDREDGGRWNGRAASRRFQAQGCSVGGIRSFVREESSVSRSAMCESTLFRAPLSPPDTPPPTRLPAKELRSGDDNFRASSPNVTAAIYGVSKQNGRLFDVLARCYYSKLIRVCYSVILP